MLEAIKAMIKVTINQSINQSTNQSINKSMNNDEKEMNVVLRGFDLHSGDIKLVNQPKIMQ